MPQATDLKLKNTLNDAESNVGDARISHLSNRTMDTNTRPMHMLNAKGITFEILGSCWGASELVSEDLISIANNPPNKYVRAAALMALLVKGDGTAASYLIKTLRSNVAQMRHDCTTDSLIPEYEETLKAFLLGTGHVSKDRSLLRYCFAELLYAIQEKGNAKSLKYNNILLRLLQLGAAYDRDMRMMALAYQVLVFNDTQELENMLSKPGHEDSIGKLFIYLSDFLEDKSLQQRLNEYLISPFISDDGCAPAKNKTDATNIELLRYMRKLLLSFSEGTLSKEIVDKLQDVILSDFIYKTIEIKEAKVWQAMLACKVVNDEAKNIFASKLKEYLSFQDVISCEAGLLACPAIFACNAVKNQTKEELVICLKQYVSKENSFTQKAGLEALSAVFTCDDINIETKKSLIPDFVKYLGGSSFGEHFTSDALQAIQVIFTSDTIKTEIKENLANELKIQLNQQDNKLTGSAVTIVSESSASDDFQRGVSSGTTFTPEASLIRKDSIHARRVIISVLPVIFVCQHVKNETKEDLATTLIGYLDQQGDKSKEIFKLNKVVINVLSTIFACDAVKIKTKTLLVQKLKIYLLDKKTVINAVVLELLPSIFACNGVDKSTKEEFATKLIKYLGSSEESVRSATLDMLFAAFACSAISFDTKKMLVTAFVKHSGDYIGLSSKSAMQSIMLEKVLASDEVEKTVKKVLFTTLAEHVISSNGGFRSDMFECLPLILISSDIATQQKKSVIEALVKHLRNRGPFCFDYMVREVVRIIFSHDEIEQEVKEALANQLVNILKDDNNSLDEELLTFLPEMFNCDEIKASIKESLASLLKEKLSCQEDSVEIVPVVMASKDITTDTKIKLAKALAKYFVCESEPELQKLQHEAIREIFASDKVSGEIKTTLVAELVMYFEIDDDSFKKKLLAFFPAFFASYGVTSDKKKTFVAVLKKLLWHNNNAIEQAALEALSLAVTSGEVALDLKITLIEEFIKYLDGVDQLCDWGFDCAAEKIFAGAQVEKTLKEILAAELQARVNSNKADIKDCVISLVPPMLICDALSSEVRETLIDPFIQYISEDFDEEVNVEAYQEILTGLQKGFKTQAKDNETKNILALLVLKMIETGKDSTYINSVTIQIIHTVICCEAIKSETKLALMQKLLPLLNSDSDIVRNIALSWILVCQRLLGENNILFLEQLKLGIQQEDSFTKKLTTKYDNYIKIAQQYELDVTISEQTDVSNLHEKRLEPQRNLTRAKKRRPRSSEKVFKRSLERWNKGESSKRLENSFTAYLNWKKRQPNKIASSRAKEAERCLQALTTRRCKHSG